MTENPAPPIDAPPPRLLRRSRSDRKLAGVCGGAGRWLGVDPLIFRIVIVVLTLFGGAGVLVYGLAWLLVPEDGSDESEGQRLFRGDTSTASVIAIVGVLVGLSMLGGGVFGGTPDLGGLVLLAILGGGILAAVRQGRGARPDWLGGASPPAPAAGAGPATGAHAAPYAPRLPYPGLSSPGPSSPGPSSPGLAYRPAAAPVARAPREPALLTWLTLSVAVLVAGVLTTVSLWSDDGIRPQVVLAAALAVLGAGLVVGAFLGRARGLIGVGAVLTLALAATAGYDVPLRGGVGERTWTPASVAEIDSPYRLAAGTARLDLTQVEEAEGEGPVTVEASVATGELVVLVPRDVNLRVEARVGLGNIELPDGLRSAGVGPQRRYVAPTAGDEELVLDLEVGVGQLAVRREAA